MVLNSSLSFFFNPVSLTRKSIAEIMNKSTSLHGNRIDTWV